MAAGRLQDWLELRRARRDGHDLLADARGRLRRGRYRLAPAVQDEVREAIVALQSSLKTTSPEAMEEPMERLCLLLDQHLAFARKSRLREYAESIGSAVVLALFLRAFVVEAFTIPSGSMLPTLQVGDDIFVAKAAYGLRIPLTDRALVVWSSPSRGDVVVFSHPHDGQDIIKRVIAVPGDTLLLRRGVLHLNSKPVPSRSLPGPCSYRDYFKSERRWVTLPCEAHAEELGGRRYVTYQAPESRQADFGPVRVPPGAVFVMGDHRDDSNDSRYFGTVPMSLIKGRALVVWWSRGGPEGVRWGRLGHPVHAASPVGHPEGGSGR